MALIPNWLKLSLAALVAASFIWSVGYLYGQHKERQRAAINQLQVDIRAERERTADDAKTRTLNDYDFCVQSLRRRGVRSLAECEQLRGLSQE